MFFCISNCELFEEMPATGQVGSMGATAPSAGPIAPSGAALGTLCAGAFNCYGAQLGQAILSSSARYMAN